MQILLIRIPYFLPLDRPSRVYQFHIQMTNAPDGSHWQGRGVPMMVLCREWILTGWLILIIGIWGDCRRVDIRISKQERNERKGFNLEFQTSSDVKETSSRLGKLEKVVREYIQREKKVPESPPGKNSWYGRRDQKRKKYTMLTGKIAPSHNQEIQNSKLAFAGCTPVENRRARGLCGTYKEEVAGSCLLSISFSFLSMCVSIFRSLAINRTSRKYYSDITNDFASVSSGLRTSLSPLYWTRHRLLIIKVVLDFEMWNSKSR